MIRVSLLKRRALAIIDGVHERHDVLTGVISRGRHLGHQAERIPVGTKDLSPFQVPGDVPVFVEAHEFDRESLAIRHVLFEVHETAPDDWPEVGLTLAGLGGRFNGSQAHRRAAAIGMEHG